MLRVLIEGLSEGIFDHVSMNTVIAPVSAETAQEEGERKTMANCNNSVKRFGEANKSNVHLVGVLLTEPNCRSRLRVLYLFAQPLRKWYNEQSVKLRSTFDHKQRLMQQVQNRFGEPLPATSAQLGDAQTLQQVGFKLKLFKDDVVMDSSHLLIGQEDSLAQTVGLYILTR